MCSCVNDNTVLESRLQRWVVSESRDSVSLLLIERHRAIQSYCSIQIDAVHPISSLRYSSLTHARQRQSTCFRYSPTSLFHGMKSTWLPLGWKSVTLPSGLNRIRHSSGDLGPSRKVWTSAAQLRFSSSSYKTSPSERKRGQVYFSQVAGPNQ